MKNIELVKELLADNKMLINAEDWSGLMYNCWEFYFDEEDSIVDLVKVICPVISPASCKRLKLESIGKELEKLCGFYNSVRDDDLSKSWSRFSWIKFALHSFDLDEDEIVDYLKQNHSKHHIKFDEIDGKYSYDESDVDYDLGYFNKKQYEKEFYEEYGEYL